MHRLHGTGWLLVGVLLGVGIPVSGLDARLLGFLEGLVPLPWSRVLLGLLLFWAAAALYFRSHWAATLAELSRRGTEQQTAARRLSGIVGDAERWAFVLRDNLLEAANLELPDRTRQLYLDGAAAHADKMITVVDRCRGVLSELERPEADAADEKDRGAA